MRAVRTLVVALTLLALGCSNGGDGKVDNTDTAIGDDVGVDTTDTNSDDTSTEPVSVTVEGAVHKGPYLLGSSVDLAKLDGNWATTGQVFSSQTKNDLGQFDLRLTVPPEGIYGELEGEGFYYNEISGEVSAAQLTLRGYAKITQAGTQNVFLNLVTHLSNRRVLYLLLNPSSIDATTYNSGDAFVDAIEQAEDELVDALDIGPSDFSLSTDGSKVNVLHGSNADNAYLLAVSAVFVKAAQLRDTGSVDSALQELLNTVASDLQSDGALETGTVDSLQQAEAAVDGDEVMAKFRQRLDDLGQQSLEVPNIHLVLDSNNDGQSNVDDGFLCGDGVAHPDRLCMEGQETGFMPLDPSPDRDKTLFVMTDVDGDGTEELLLASDQSSFAIHEPANPLPFESDGRDVDVVDEGVKYLAHTWASADLDGNASGASDLVFAQFEECSEPSACLQGAGSKLVVLRADPTDTQNYFAAPEVIGAQGDFHPSQIRLADLDGNGYLDIVVLQEGLREDGASAGECAVGVREVDGRDVYTNKQPDSVRVFLADDSGVYPSVASQSFVVSVDGSIGSGSQPAGFVRDLEVDDIDADGKGELVVAVAPSCGVNATQQKSLLRIHEFESGAFAGATDLERPNADIIDITLVNIDGNERLDVAFTQRGLGGPEICYAVYFNHEGPKQALVERSEDDTCSLNGVHVNLHALDLDGDGTDDILMGVRPGSEGYQHLLPAVQYGGSELDPTTASEPYTRANTFPPMADEQAYQYLWPAMVYESFLMSSTPLIARDFNGDGHLDFLSMPDNGDMPMLVLQNP